MKVGYKKFSDGTSMHGFTELYYAKNKFWKTFWILIVVGALGVTSYQVYGAIHEYLYQSSFTTIEPASKEDIFLPPLKICFSHWMQWVDFKLAEQKGFSRSSTLFALSYLTTIYSNSSFNKSVAADEFKSTLSMKNFSSLFSFFNAISRQIGSLLDEGSNLFNDTEFFYSELTGLHFCYVASGENIRRYFNGKIHSSHPDDKTKTKGNFLKISVYDFRAASSFGDLTDQEYNAYVSEWIQLYMRQYYIQEDGLWFAQNFANVVQDYTKINIPSMLFVDGYSDFGVRLAEQVDEYFVTLRASAHKFKPSSHNPCCVGIRSVVSNTSCAKNCHAEAELTFYNCIPFDMASRYLNHVLDIDRVCQHEIVFLNPEDEDFSYTPKVQERTADTSVYDEHVDNCTNLCMEGCEKWRFDVSLTTGSVHATFSKVAVKGSSVIRIEYPFNGDTLVMTETDSQSWENFVGNVGGLLGIWTGASIVSFVQLFYLCCCAENSCSFSDMHCWHPRQYEGSPPKNVSSYKLPRKTRKPVSVEQNNFFKY